ncbi:hypothetical protein WN943_020094 [Citrus x changshan-huyou]
MTTPWLRQLWSSKSLRTSSYNSSLTPQLPMIVYKALLGQSGADPLSIHRRERETQEAQELSLGPPDSTLDLDRAGQHNSRQALPEKPGRSPTTSLPHLVTGSRH